MPAKPLLQELAFRDDLAGASGQVEEERVLTVGEKERPLRQEHPVLREVDHEVAKSHLRRHRKTAKMSAKTQKYLWEPFCGFAGFCDFAVRVAGKRYNEMTGGLNRSNT